jgi:hypothetical protein
LIAPSQKNNHITLRAHKIQRLTFKSALIAVKIPHNTANKACLAMGKKPLGYSTQQNYHTNLIENKNLQ